MRKLDTVALPSDYRGVVRSARKVGSKIYYDRKAKTGRGYIKIKPRDPKDLGLIQAMAAYFLPEGSWETYTMTSGYSRGPVGKAIRIRYL